jgi:L-rhamnose isomerase
MAMSSERAIRQNYENAKETFAQYGVSVEDAVKMFGEVPVSVHNWQGDDVRGFEGQGSVHSENVVTGNYPGAARNGDEMRADLEEAFRYSPCKHRLNLHSMYAEPPAPRERNAYGTEDYRKWIDWAKAHRYGIDFNVSYFTHPRMKNGCSLTSPDRDTREYWIKAGIASREISSAIGRELGTPCVNNLWIPDGTKDMTADRAGYRARLTESLDRIFEKRYDGRLTRDVLEGKVFGIGTECFVVGSHDFYLAYAVKNHIGITYDTGHFHPNESYFDKITAVYLFVDSMMFHISRGIRWDSDHCLIQDDGLQNVMLELKRADLLDKNVALGLDYFDATLNRVTAWVIGLRAFGKALLAALLEPTQLIRAAEYDGNPAKALALLDETKNMPVNAVWDHICLTHGVGTGTSWLDAMDRYEREVQFKRA